MLYYDFLLVYVCSIQRCIPQDHNSPDPEPPISQIRTEAWSVLSIKAKVISNGISTGTVPPDSPIRRAIVSVRSRITG